MSAEEGTEKYAEYLLQTIPKFGVDFPFAGSPVSCWQSPLQVLCVSLAGSPASSCDVLAGGPVSLLQGPFWLPHQFNSTVKRSQF